MASKQGSRMIVGLDIGTSKVVALVGEIGADGQLEIVGIGSHPSRGLKKGVVVNIESTVQSIQRAIEEAELMAGCQIHSVFAGVAGNHIRSLNSHGIVAIRDREVIPADIERVLDAAQAVADQVEAALQVRLRAAPGARRRAVVGPHGLEVREHGGDLVDLPLAARVAHGQLQVLDLARRHLAE